MEAAVMNSTNKIAPPTNIDDTNKEYGVVIGILILGIVSTAFALARLWCRATTKVVGPDDYATMSAVVGSPRHH